jgi:hypothetical protein
MASAPAKERPLPAESVPKITPKGMAPMTSGMVAFIPAKNSVVGELGKAAGCLVNTCAITDSRK